MLNELSTKMAKCKRILIVEDDEAICSMMKDVLEMEGYCISIANDGSEGIKHLKASDKKPCVILLDLMMPGTNGWKFLDFQRSDPNMSSIPVVVCSAFQESAKSIHAEAIINKPVDLNVLLNTVHGFCA